MRITFDEDSFTLGEMSEPEWFLLQRLPQLAAGEGLDPAASSRLSPDPLDVPAGARAEHEEFVEDWKEYVMPDILDGFGEARNTVKSDLIYVAETTEVLDNGEEATEFALRVDRENVDPWYSTLNQARLLMNEAYDIASVEKEIMESEDGEAADDPGKRILVVQNGFYSFIQSYFLEHLMS